jgi:hypothetical protein
MESCCPGSSASCAVSLIAAPGAAAGIQLTHYTYEAHMEKSGMSILTLWLNVSRLRRASRWISSSASGEPITAPSSSPWWREARFAPDITRRFSYARQARS